MDFTTYILTDYVCSNLEEGESFDEFIIWSLGEDWLDCSLSYIPRKWNQLHSELFEMQDDGNPWEDLNKMMSLWRDAVKKA